MKKFKKIVWKIWKCWLVISIPINVISLFFMACCLDSNTILPGLIGLLNAVWLLLIIFANSDQEKNNEQIKRYNRNEIWEIDSDSNNRTSKTR